MKDSLERILYVGQSRNLKQRVGSYRYVCRERHSRRLVRLVHSVEQITWEITNSEAAAIEKEAELLRELRPKFNRAGTYVRPEWFLHLEHDSNGLVVGRTEEWDAAHIGPFKASLQTSFAAVLRLSWLLLERKAPASLPRQLLLQNAPRQWRFPASTAAEKLAAFLSGRSGDLLDDFNSLQYESPFYIKFIEADREQAMRFYDQI